IALALAVAWVSRGRRARDLTPLGVWLGLVLVFAVPWYALLAARRIPIGSEHVGGFYLHPLWIAGHVASALGEPALWGVWWAGAALLAVATAPAWLTAALWTRWLGFVVAAELVAVLNAYVVSAHAGK